MILDLQQPHITSVFDRARRYIATMEPAISGQDGHKKCFSAACKLVIGFGLSEDDAYRILDLDYNPRCDPPWTEKELRHKIRSAMKQEGERGSLVGDDIPPWERNGSHTKDNRVEPKLTPAIKTLGELMAKIRSGEGEVLYWAGEPFERFECGPGKITVLGAPPGAGKTAITMQYIFSLLENDQNAKVVIANAEMSFEVLLRRELTRRSGVPGRALRFADLSESQLASIEDASSSLVSLLDRVEVMNPPYGPESLSGLLGGGDGRLLVVDYLQKFSGGDDPRIGVNLVMGSLRTLAFDGWGILALSSVTRVKKGEQLSMSSFKESGEIEFNADACYLLRDEGPSGSDERIRDVLLDNVKNRHDELANIPLVFDKPHMSFSSRIQPHDFGWDNDEESF